MMNQMISQNDITASLLDEGWSEYQFRFRGRPRPHSARMSSRAPTSASEGLEQDLSLVVREIGADQARVQAVEALAEPVEVRVLGDEEQRGRARLHLLANAFDVLLGDAGAVHRLDGR